MTQTDMTPLQRLAKVLQLGTPSNYRNHTYINGESLYFPTGRVYGGQVIAQSLMAASRTVAPSRLPNSIHGYFISAGVIQRSGTPGVRVCGRINSCSKAVRWAGVCRRKRSLTSAPSSS